MLSFNELLRATLNVTMAEVAREAWVIRAATQIDKQKDFEEFLSSMTGQDAGSAAPSKGIGDLMREVGSF